MVFMDYTLLSKTDWNTQANIFKQAHMLQTMRELQGTHVIDASGDSSERFIVSPENGEREWVRLAACRGMDTDVFFPSRGERKKAREAIRICESCDVRVHCLVDALETEPAGYSQGVRGGVLARRRTKMVELMKKGV